jgi:hypothetical protein
MAGKAGLEFPGTVHHGIHRGNDCAGSSRVVPGLGPRLGFRRGSKSCADRLCARCTASNGSALDWQSGWGLGFAIRRVNNVVRIGHSGGLPGQRTQIEIAPALKLGVIVLTNANDGEPLRYVEQAFTLLSPALAAAAAPPEAPRAPDPQWQRYVGRYAWKFSEMQIQILNGELTMIVPDDDNPWSSRIILKPVGPNTFRMDAAGFTSGTIGENLTFEMDANGKVTRVRTPDFYWLPME